MAEQNKSVVYSYHATERLFDSIRVGEDVVAIQALLQEGADVDAIDPQGYTPLLLAFIHGRKNIVGLLINSVAAVDVKCNSDECTVLHYASQHGWLKIARILVKTVPDLDARDIRGETAMHHAARSGCLKVVKCLVNAGADIDIKNCVGRTPLVCAVQCLRIDVVDLLLKSRAKVDGNEGVLLHYASERGWTELVLYLVERVPDLNKFYQFGVTALYVASTSGHLEVVKYLVDSGADVNTRCSNGDTAFHKAACEGHLEIVKYLMEKGADINSTRYESGETALHLATDGGYIEVAKWLVENGADINTLDKKCETPLHIASGMQRGLGIVKCLLNAGTESINKQNTSGMTALHYAATLGRLYIVKCLLKKGTDVNIKDSNGDTALHNTAYQGDIEIVKCLVEKGADINVKNLEDNTPVLHAAIASRKDVVYLLMQCGANLDTPNKYKYTLLHCASEKGWIEIMQSIVKQNCNLDARDINGVTALGYACENQNLESAQYLLHAGASWNILDRFGYSPLNYVTSGEEPKLKLIKLFIESGSYLSDVDYEAIVMSSSWKVLQDVELCSQAIINKYNNHYLPKLYKLPASGCLPRFEEMKIASGSEKAQAIKRTVEFEIQTKGHCNILQVRAMVLSVFSVVSLLEYCDRKKSALPNSLKRPHSPSDICQKCVR